MRPLGATDSVPNQCHLLELTGSSLIRRGALKVSPPSVLRTNITSVVLRPGGTTLASMYMLLLVAVTERSIARNNCPSSPAGLIPPEPRLPPMLTEVVRSKVGIWPPFCALLERTQLKLLNPSPPIKRLPLVSTSSVPRSVPPGTTMGACQVTPPLVERWNSTPPPLQLMPSSDWYWKPCPGPLVLSMVNQ